MDVHQVTSGHLSASPMCLVVKHSAPPAQTASWCHQSSLLNRCPTNLKFSIRRRYLRQPSRESWNDIYSVNRFLVFVTDILHLQWTLQWQCHLVHSKNTLIDWLIDWLIITLELGDVIITPMLPRTDFLFDEGLNTKSYVWHTSRCWSGTCSPSGPHQPCLRHWSPSAGH